MGIQTIPAPSAASKTRYAVTLTSGTSWTVPTGVTYVNATLVGGGGGGGSTDSTARELNLGLPGATIETNVATTPGASITYAIGAGGTAGSAGGAGGTGGTTTFTGATSATGGGGSSGTNGAAGPNGLTSFANNGGGGAGPSTRSGGTGGSGWISLEYWA